MRILVLHLLWTQVIFHSSPTLYLLILTFKHYFHSDTDKNHQTLLPDASPHPTPLSHSSNAISNQTSGNDLRNDIWLGENFFITSNSTQINTRNGHTETWITIAMFLDFSFAYKWSMISLKIDSQRLHDWKA